MQGVLNVKVKFLPKSTLGKWTTGLTVLGLFLLAFMIVFAEILEIVNSDKVITISALLAIAMLIAPCVTGTVAVLKNKDKALTVFISVVVGFLTVAFLIAARFGPE
jgi:hypothetical protein